MAAWILTFFLVTCTLDVYRVFIKKPSQITNKNSFLIILNLYNVGKVLLSDMCLSTYTATLNKLATGAKIRLVSIFRYF